MSSVKSLTVLWKLFDVFTHLLIIENIYHFLYIGLVQINSKLVLRKEKAIVIVTTRVYDIIIMTLEKKNPFKSEIPLKSKPRQMEPFLAIRCQRWCILRAKLGLKGRWTAPLRVSVERKVGFGKNECGKVKWRQPKFGGMHKA